MLNIIMTIYLQQCASLKKGNKFHYNIKLIVSSKNSIKTTYVTGDCMKRELRCQHHVYFETLNYS